MPSFLGSEEVEGDDELEPPEVEVPVPEPDAPVVEVPVPEPVAPVAEVEDPEPAPAAPEPESAAAESALATVDRLASRRRCLRAAA